jgi:cytoskeletal protein CcmA (bactofilin family)
MDVSLAALLLVALAVAWICLPFMPGVCELLELGDCAPVRVAPESDVNIRHHAHGFRKFVAGELSGPVIWSRADGRRQQGRLADGMPYLVLPEREDDPGVDGHGKPSRTLLVATGSLNLPEGGVHLAEIFAEGAIKGGARSTYRALLSDDSIELGADSRTLRWLDARTAFRAGAGSRLDGRASAGEVIELAPGCRFERLWAPRIVFGTDRFNPAARLERPPAAPADLGVSVEVAAGRWLVRGPLVLEAGAVIEADLVVTGSLTVGPGSRITGSLKSRQDLRLGRDVVVDGSVVGERSIDLDAGCDIGGPLLAEETVTIAAGCRIGRPEQPTTVSARRVRIHDGVVVHGTVWAHDGGMVGTERE